MASCSMSPSTLLHLNDDCLDGIFNNFTLNELMDIYGELHPRIDDAVERQLHRFRHYEFCMREPPKYGLRKIQVLGQYLHSVSMNIGYSTRPTDALAILHPLCVGAQEGRRLRALQLRHVILTNDYIEVVLKVVPLLRVLDISQCDVTDSQLKRVLEMTASLHTLMLINTGNITDKSYMPILNRLQCLKLTKPPQIPPTELCKRHEKLSLIIYDLPFCVTCTVYGRAMELSPNNAWYKEY